MQIVTRDYQGFAIAYQDDGWFNATQAAMRFGKRVDKWLENQDTKDYIAALSESPNTPKGGYLKAKRGRAGGTWLHPRLAVHFARWIDPKFAVWCDDQIAALLSSNTDWLRLRHVATSSNKVVNAMLQEVRRAIGKETQPHHFMTEAKLVNWAHSGEFTGLDRDGLTAAELDLLAFLELKSATLIGRLIPYADRKPLLKQYAIDWRLERTPMLPIH